MTDLLITLASCAAMILGVAFGYWLGYRIEKKDGLCMNKFWEDNYHASRENLGRLSNVIAELNGKLAKFQQPPRGKNGKFLAWKEKI